MEEGRDNAVILCPESILRAFFIEVTPMKLSVKKLCVLAMLAAVSFIVANTLYISIFPAAPFLKYEPKDVIITIGGFLYGPLASLLISVVVSLPEMLISGTGPIGGVMDILSTCSFACVAALLYKRRHTLAGAVSGLALGSVLMVIAMLLWNWLVSPLYMGVERAVIESMLLPIFLPFNLLKTGLNSALVLFLYKPVVTALRKAGLVEAPTKNKGTSRLGIYLFAAVLLITCVLLILVIKGIL
jgi:riboflavin transporter FmnP